MFKELTETEKGELLYYNKVLIHPKQAFWIRRKYPDVIIDYCGSLCGISHSDYSIMPWQFNMLPNVLLLTKNELFVYYDICADELPTINKFVTKFFVSLYVSDEVEYYSPVLVLDV